MDVYAQHILDHAKNPRNKGCITDATTSREEHNTSCGDEVLVDLVIKDDVISEMKFEGSGCVISQSATSILTEELTGSSVQDALNMKREDIHELLGIDISQRREKCALLGLLAIQNAILEMQGQELRTFRDLA